MATGFSDDADNQRDKSAKKKGIAADKAKTGADDAEESSGAPSRVHIFKGDGKSLPGASSSSKSDSGDKPLRRSLFREDRLVRMARGAGMGAGAGQAAILAGVRSPIVVLKEELMFLRHRIEMARRAAHGAAMKAEDLQGIIQGAQDARDHLKAKVQQFRQSRQSISNKRR